MIDPIFADDVTAQQLFDRVWTKFVVERAPRSVAHMDDRLSCRYRGPCGTACAVGVLVTDAECDGWDHAYGSPSSNSLAAWGKLPPRLIPHAALLSDLQRAHDSHEGEFVHVEALRDVAAERGLAIPEAQS